MSKPGPGKFEGNASLEMSEVFHAWVMNGLVDESCYPADGHVTNLVLVADGDQAYQQLVDADTAGEVTSIELGILLHEDSNGFFTYEIYESFEAARTVFADWVKAEHADEQAELEDNA